MNDYRTSTPRAALGLTAVAMAVITVSALVILPMKLESGAPGLYAVAATNEVRKPASGVAGTPVRAAALERSIAKKIAASVARHAGLKKLAQNLAN